MKLLGLTDVPFPFAPAVVCRSSQANCYQVPSASELWGQRFTQDVTFSVCLFEPFCNRTVAMSVVFVIPSLSLSLSHTHTHTHTQTHFLDSITGT